VLLDKKGFCKERFVPRIVPNMEKKDKNKPSEGSEYHMKVLSKS
jgi:hypothetical protein